MPISFRTYNDPGVYIENITPPVVFTAAIEPTILAIVGAAPDARNAFDSANLSSGDWVDLTTRGGDPSTLDVTDKLLGTQYVSAAIASLDSAVGTGTGSWTVSTYGTRVLPATPFNVRIEDEIVTVSAATNGNAQTWTISARAQSSTVAASHGAGQVLNNIELYSTTASIEVAQLASPISETQDEFDVNELYGVQVVTLTGYSGTDSFKLTYGGQESAAIVRGTNYTLAGIKTAVEALSTVTTVTVNDFTGTTTLTDSGFQVRFENPNTSVTALTVTSGVGVTGTVANRGVANNTYLDVEGERMRVTAVTGSAPQHITATRAFAGTTADSHGAVNVYENTGADYLIKLGVGEDTALGTADDILSLYILDGARIADGAFVNVAFEATDAAQFNPTEFDDLDNVREKYGDPLDSNGEVNSELTLGAQLALANGATQLVLVATDPAEAEPIQDGIDKLAFRQDVNSIVILSGDASDISYVKGHVVQMSDEGVLRRAFVGLDGLSGTIPTFQNFIDKSALLHTERVSVVAPSRFKLDNGTGTPILVAGYFGAAAVAGLQAGLLPQEPLTRKQIFGFVGLDDQDSTQNIFRMQAGGVLVVFQDRLSRLIIKHGLTTDMTSVYTREVSVITARDRLRDFIFETLDGGALIGSPMTSETPNLVMAAVSSALEESIRQGLIFDYSDVKYRFPTENPTLIQVRFAYKPSLPLNYIHVQFSIDTNVGTVDFQSINDNTST